MLDISPVSAISPVRAIEPVGSRGSASTAVLEATLRRLQKELAELRAEQRANESSSTRTGQAAIEMLVNKIAAIEARLARQTGLIPSAVATSPTT